LGSFIIHCVVLATVDLTKKKRSLYSFISWKVLESGSHNCKGLGCVCVVVRSLPVDGTCVPKTGETNSEQTDCKPMTMTGESIPGVDCIGKEWSSWDLLRQVTTTYSYIHVLALLLGLNISSQEWSPAQDLWAVLGASCKLISDSSHP